MQTLQQPDRHIHLEIVVRSASGPNMRQWFFGDEQTSTLGKWGVAELKSDSVDDTSSFYNGAAGPRGRQIKRERLLRKDCHSHKCCRFDHTTANGGWCSNNNGIERCIVQHSFRIRVSNRCHLCCQRLSTCHIHIAHRDNRYAIRAATCGSVLPSHSPTANHP